ncbi:MAG: superoxide dismutase family protein [bacterium]|nr:superoxide dismutase family protein [bacterium]
MEIKRSRRAASAAAIIRGSSAYPQIKGKIVFLQKSSGVLVTAEIYGLPPGQKCRPGIFALHIHSGTGCSGNSNDPFADAGSHFNPGGCEHPYHAGDLPPLFGNNGYAYMSVFTNRFTVSDIINRVIIIHKNPDDFTTQPSGNSGEKIACGKINPA